MFHGGARKRASTSPRAARLIINPSAAMGVLPGIAPHFGPFLDERMGPPGGWVDDDDFDVALRHVPRKRKAARGT